MGFFLVMKAELVRSFIIMRRYWFATVMGMIVGYGMLIGLIFGFRSGTVDAHWATDQTEKVLGFVVGIFAFGIVGMFSQGLQGMARTGELEQVYMSPHGLITNFLARSFVSSLISIPTWTILLVFVSATLNSNLHADPFPTFVILLLTYLNLIGFGFMVGGLTLVFKQIGQATLLIRMGMVAVAFAANPDWYKLPAVILGAAHVVPITDASICLKLVLIKGMGLGVFSHPSFLFLLINVALWTTLGVACFKYMENWSRDKGTLGAY
ncbi:MAG: ABC transporter permease [Candidatus Hydrogenedentes bacterium]|nr:ABC transporter permease [Candidatus Hydrogenedentota bacterium]